MDSEQLLRQQEQESIKRNLKKNEKKTAPLISLADKRQLQDVSPALSAHEKRLNDFRQRVTDHMPESLNQVEGQRRGNLRENETLDLMSAQYVSITSGYDIESLEEDLLGLWKYQRYNFKDSSDMLDLKMYLGSLTRAIRSRVTFTSREDVRTNSAEMRGKYEDLIVSCEKYLRNHKSPWTIAGKARKSMAEKLIKAAKAEMDMIEDSAWNCYSEAKALNVASKRAIFRWKDILHRGRIVNINTDRDHIRLNPKDQNVMEIVREGSGEREYLTVARNLDELEECRKIVAISKIAEKLGCGNLSGAGEMNTRMTTMIINGKTVVGCITSGLTKTTMEAYRYESQKIKRPGAGSLGERKTAYSADYLQGLMLLPFLDYLCGVSGRREDSLSPEKTETHTGVTIGRIQATPHRLENRGFGTDVPAVPSLQNVWLDPSFAERILSLNPKDLLEGLTGVLNEDQKLALTGRLDMLKAAIREAAGPGASFTDQNGVEHLKRDALPANFKDRTQLEEAISTPGTLAAYARSQKDGIHKAIREDMAANIGTVQSDTLPSEGKLLPLKGLIAGIQAPKGKNKEKLSKSIGGLSQLEAAFTEGLILEVPLSKGRASVMTALEDSLLNLNTIKNKCKDYLKNSSDDEDFSNRIAVGRLLHASDYQETLFIQHVLNMCDYADRLKAAHSDRALSMTFSELFNEAMIIAGKERRAGEFSIDELYQGVELTEEELLTKTGTESFATLGGKLSDSLKKREDEGKENSEAIEAVSGRLQELTEFLDTPVTLGGFNDFISHLNELMDACNAYVEKQEKRPFGGSLSKSGKGRLDIVDELQHMIENECGIMLQKKEEGGFAVKAPEVEKLIQSVIKNGKKREQVTFRDLSIAVKRNTLIEQEKALSEGKTVKASERRLRKASERLEKGQIQGQGPLGQISAAQKRSGDLEKELPKGSFGPGFNELSESLDAIIESRKDNSPEIIACADKLGEIVELKNRPIFTANSVQIYEDRLKHKGDPNYGDPDIYLKSDIISSVDKLVKLLNEFTDARDAYLEKQNEKLFGGVLSGQERMDILKDAYTTGHQEYEAFSKVEKGKRSVDSDLLLAILKDIMASGKPLGEISLTDLTNKLRLDSAAKGGKDKAEKVLRKTEAKAQRESGTGREDTDMSELARLSKGLNDLRGKKWFKKDDSVEFQAVADGLNALLEIKGSADKEVLASYYERLISACTAYLNLHAGKTNDRMTLISQIKTVCMGERPAL